MKKRKYFLAQHSLNALDFTISLNRLFCPLGPFQDCPNIFLRGAVQGNFMQIHTLFTYLALKNY